MNQFVKHRGVTLIELVIVIAILGILAAIVVPKFIDLSEEAAAGVIKQNGGALGSVFSTAQAKYLAQGGTGGSIVVPGPVVIPMNTNNWPGTTPMTVATCNLIWTGLMASAPPVSGGFTPNSPGYGVFANAAGTCFYIYQPDPTPIKAIIYNANTGSITYFNV